MRVPQNRAGSGVLLPLVPQAGPLSTRGLPGPRTRSLWPGPESSGPGGCGRGPGRPVLRQAPIGHPPASTDHSSTYEKDATIPPTSMSLRTALSFGCPSGQDDTDALLQPQHRLRVLPGARNRVLGAHFLEGPTQSVRKQRLRGQTNSGLST